MSAMVSRITSPTIVYSTVYSGEDQGKHESSASLPFVRGIRRSLVNSPHKGPVTRKMFPFDDVIMDSQRLKSSLSKFCNIKQHPALKCRHISTLWRYWIRRVDIKAIRSFHKISCINSETLHVMGYGSHKGTVTIRYRRCLHCSQQRGHRGAALRPLRTRATIAHTSISDLWQIIQRYGARAGYLHCISNGAVATWPQIVVSGTHNCV